MQENALDNFGTKFKVDNYLIAISKHWRLSLRPNQSTLGSSILSLNRFCENFSGISSAESSDLREIISYTESQLKRSFDFDKINYLMLMMVDPHLHFHVIPRYSKPIEFLDHEWNDENWPTPPDLGGREVTESEAFSIIQAIKSA